MAASFYGRETELAWLRGLWAQPSAALVVYGPPGIGKTRLLRQAVDGVWVQVPDDAGPDAVCAVVAAALGVAPGPDLATRIPRALEHQAVVVDCDSVLPPESWGLLQAWTRAPRVRLAVAARMPPRTSEWDRALLEPLSQDAACALLAARAAVPVDGAVRDLVEQLDRHPLALELAATRVPMLGVQGVVDRLSPALLRDRHNPQRSIRAALGWSWSMLAPDEREAALRLSLFVGPIDVDVASCVLGPAALDQLDALFEHGWVRRAPHLSLPSAVRAHCLALGADTPERRAVWVQGCLDAIQPLRIDGLYSALSRQPLDIADRWLLTEHTQGVDHALTALLVFADEPAPHRERAKTVPLIQGALSVPDLPCAIHAELSLLAILVRSTPPDQRMAELDRAGRALPATPAVLTRISQLRGNNLLVGGDSVAAQAHYEHALENAAPGSWWHALAVSNLGICRATLNDVEGAIAYWEQTLAFPAKVMSPDARAQNLHNLAKARAHIRGGEGTRALLEQALRESYTAVLPAQTQLSLTMLAELDALQGTPSDPSPLLLRIQDSARSNVPGSLLNSVLQMWTVAIESGSLSVAADLVAQARDLMQTQGQVWMEATVIAAEIVTAALAGTPIPAMPPPQADLLVDRALVLAFADPDAPVPEPNPKNLYDTAWHRWLGRLRGPALRWDGKAFELGDGSGDLSRRGPARKLMAHLVRTHGQGLQSAETLVEAGWPGERMRWDAAKNRLHVTLSLLRKLGLGAALQSVDGGYQLDPALRITTE